MRKKNILVMHTSIKVKLAYQVLTWTNGYTLDKSFYPDNSTTKPIKLDRLKIFNYWQLYKKMVKAFTEYMYKAIHLLDCSRRLIGKKCI